MKVISTTARISIGLASITLSAMLIAGLLGLIPDRNLAVMEGRARLCEATAISFTLLAQEDDFERLRLGLEAIVDHDPDLLTAAARQSDGSLVARVGDHDRLWNNPDRKELAGAEMFVPIMLNGELWGALEFCFEPLEHRGWQGVWQSSGVRLPLFVMFISVLGSWVYLRRVLRYLDPSKVVPARVRQALDTLTEGLLLLDKDERIVLANRAFTITSGVAEKQLLGRKASALPWIESRGEVVSSDLPWQKVLRGEDARGGSMLSIKPGTAESRTFMVNAAPILDDRGRSQGALTSFGDVTSLENKKTELAGTLAKLQDSAQEIRRQNTELERLATEDPLTGCLNRRSLFESFETYWSVCDLQGQQLSCVMVDIDHFKSVNDRFGHSVGDEVLKKVAVRLQQSAREGDIVCRYGGEEFCVLMRDADIEAACYAAERLRKGVAELKFPQLAITASFGVSSRELKAASPQELLDQADKCLYVAKKKGRNCVVSFDNIPAEVQIDESTLTRSNRVPIKQPDAEQPVPFHAVISLISALAYRDLTTAEHSRRVADLCVLVAEGLMSPSQCYLLEIAALLHDIGKIGVPDSILLKAGPLTPEEREIMRTHQSNGVSLVRASFKSPELCSILENRSAPPNGTHLDPKTGKQVHIPLGTRILAIADSYDAMVSDSIYRQARTRDDAFAELRRCGGVQFDPELVERFIACVSSCRRETTDRNGVSKEAALSIGMHIEHLVTALERQDFTSLKDLAGHMHLLATKQGAGEIAVQAANLQSTLDSEEADLLAVLNEADSLLKLCRETQRAYFDGIRPAGKSS